MNLKNLIEKQWPLVVEARKHNNRPLMQDLIAPIMKLIEREMQESTESRKGSLSIIKREIKQYMLKTAYTEDSEGLLEPDDVGPTQGIGGLRKAKGVLQDNTKDFTSLDIREVKSSSEDFLDDEDHFSPGEDSDPGPLKKYGDAENFELDIDAETCDDPLMPFSKRDYILEDAVTEDTLIEDLEQLKQRVLAGEKI